MRVRGLRPILLSVVLLILTYSTFNLPHLTHAAATPQPADIREFHLLSAEGGWLWLNQRLYWTDDGGQRWRDITPLGQAQAISAVFFLDIQHGWQLLSESASTDLPSYALARTANGGRTWQTQSLALLQPDDPDALSHTAYLHFVNAQTGWLVVKRATSNAFSAGALFKTTDGGISWTRLSIPIGEPVYFVNEQVGWTAGGAAAADVRQRARRRAAPDRERRR